MTNFYKSKEWIEIREWAIAKYGAKCQKCGSTHEIQCDHVLPRSLYPGLALNKFNVGILCGPCNKAKAAKLTKDYRPIMVRIKWRLHRWIKYCLALLLVCGWLAALLVAGAMTR